MKLLIAVLILFSINCSSQENKQKFGIDTSFTLPTGIEKGIKAPIINALDIHGDSINSRDLLKDKQIVLLFYRGEWCPVCNKYLSNLNDSLNYIKEKNAIIVVVGTELIEKATKTEKKTDADFIIISDTSYTIQNDYNVLFKVTKGYQTKIKTLLLTDIAKNNGKEDAFLPIPATYIINQKGFITFKHFDYNYHNRASVKEIIDNL